MWESHSDGVKNLTAEKKPDEVWIVLTWAHTHSARQTFAYTHPQMYFILDFLTIFVYW